MYRYKKLFTFFMVVCIVLCAVFPAMADVNDLSIYTDSNAYATDSNAGIMMLSDDSGISLTSSLASVTNTVDYDYVELYVRLLDEETGMYDYVTPRVQSDGTYSYRVPSGYMADVWGFRLKKGALPVSGKYRLQIDNSANNSDDYEVFQLVSFKYTNNASTLTKTDDITKYMSQFSGDFYGDFVVDIGNVNILEFKAFLPGYHSGGAVFSGLVKFNFTATNATADVTTVTGPSDYENEVSSSLSGISSGMADQAESIQNVAEAVQSLQASMEPHYDNVLTQMHHITEQLHAFWNQLYNMFYLPQYARLGEILDALNGLGPDLTGSLQALANAITSKLQSVQDAIVGEIQESTEEITNGFDNFNFQMKIDELDSFMAVVAGQENAILESFDSFMYAPDEYTQPVFDFGSLPYGILSALGFIGAFMNYLFVGMGAFGSVAICGLTLTYVLIVIGYYRIRR